MFNSVDDVKTCILSSLIEVIYSVDSEDESTEVTSLFRRKIRSLGKQFKLTDTENKICITSWGLPIFGQMKTFIFNLLNLDTS